MTRPSAIPRRDLRLVIVWALGLTVSALMVVRSQIAGDQLNMLTRGWLLAFEGEVVPVGMPMSGGGFVPGSLTSLLVGLPLLVWEHHRSPTFAVFLLHGLGYVLLDRMLATVLARDERFLFALFYWLSPWRLFYSGFLWTPNYMPAIGALHTWTIFQQRRRGGFWLSFAHVGVLGTAVQLHPSSLLLAISSALLLWRRYFRINLAGALLGATASALALLPWLLFVLREPLFLPFGSEATEWSRLVVVPVVRGIALLLRYSSLMPGTALLCIDFTDIPLLSLFGDLRGAVRAAKTVLGLVTVPLALWAHIRLWRRRRWQPFDPSLSDRSWLRGFVGWSILAALVTFALSPTTIMNWQALAMLHVAVLPLVLLGVGLLRSRRSRLARRVVAAWAIFATVLGFAMALGSPPYRCSSDSCGIKAFQDISLRADHPMLDDLAIRSTCDIAIDDPSGWWPDVLPDEPGKPWYRVESDQTGR